MSFTAYRSKSTRTLWTKYHSDRVCRMPVFRTWPIDDICAEHWKRNAPIFDCVKALEDYLVNEVGVLRNESVET